MVKVGKDWARTGRTADCMVFCTGADEDKLKSRLVNAVQTQIKRDRLTWIMQRGIGVGGASGIGSIWYRVREFDYGDRLESENCAR